MITPIIALLAAVPLLPTIVYPTLMRVAAVLAKPHRTLRWKELPRVTLVISAFNEEHVIRRKLGNALALDYPKTRLEIIVVTDGSTDRTDSIVAEYASMGVRLLSSPENRGKSLALNEAVAAAAHDLLVFSDANSMFEPQALKRLVAPLADPKVGYVSGALVYTRNRNNTAENGEIAYWSHDSAVKRAESAFGMLLSGNGSIVALRKSVAVRLDGDTANDFAWCVAARIQGFACQYVPDAIATEAPAGTIRGEFRRKTRISLRGLWMHANLPHFVNTAPRRASGTTIGLLALQMISSKLARYLAFPVLALITVLAIAGGGLLSILAIGAIVGVVVAALVSVLHRVPPVKRLITWLPDFAYPLAMAGASFVSLSRFLLRSRVRTWRKERAVAELTVVPDIGSRAA